jgi:enoyl-CoA hydratase
MGLRPRITAMAEFVLAEQDGAVAVITIDHPPVNALSAPLLEELEAEIERLDADDGVRAIVLRGAGERAFVAGADISEFPSLRAAADEAHEGGSARGIQKLGHRMDAAHTPFVAAIHGFCLGGGLELAMCCDIRVAADGAQLGQPEIKLGLIPGGGGTQRLPRLVGLGRAQLLNMTGDFIDAQTAYEWGLVEKVVPMEELLEAALGIARTIAARSPVSIGMLRELARTTRDLPLEEGLRREADAFRRCLGSEDGAEGVAAFLEKREPQFTGH